MTPGTPTRAQALAEGVLRGADSGRRKLLAALLLLGVGVTAAGALAWSRGTASAPADAPPVAAAPADGAEPRLDAEGEPLPPDAVLRLGSLHLRHRDTVRSVVFSRDGKLAISGGWDRIIRFWDPETGKEVRQARASEKGVDAMALSPDGTLLAGAGMDGAVLLWDAATGREVRRLEGHRGAVHAVAFSPKGDRLVSHDNATVRFWEVATGKLLRSVEVGEGNPGLAYSPDGRLVAAAGGGPAVLVLDADTGKRVRELRGEGTYVFALAFAPGGAELVSAVENGPLTVWDLGTGKPGRPFPDRLQGTHSLAFSPDGKLLATGGGDNHLRLWDWPARRLLWDVAAHPDGVSSLSFAPDGKTLASSSAEEALHFWDVATGKPLHRTRGHQERVNAVACSPDGRTIVTGAWDGTVRVWDATSGRELTVLTTTDKGQKQLPYNRYGAVSRVALAPDGKLVAAVSDYESIRVWELPSGKEVYRLRGNSVAFSPDGKLIAVGGRGTQGAEVSMGVIYLHDRATGKPVRELHGHRTQIGSVAFTPDGRTLISQGTVLIGMRTGEPGESETEYLRFWDVATGRQRRGFPRRSPLITSMAVSPDGRTLATFGDLGRSVVLIEMLTGGERTQLQASREMLFQVAFAPDGRTLASGGIDGIIRLWDLPSGKEVGRLEGHRGWVLALAFAPEGRRLVSSGTDTTALVWDVSRFTRREAGTTAPTADELRLAWVDLGSEAGLAYRAVGTFASAPEDAVPFLDERLKPAAAPDEKQVARLLGELDGERFEERERATAELAKLGPLAEEAIRRALAGKPSAEARRRLRRLLEQLDAVVPPPEETRGLRAVEALERMGTPAARQLLATLAGGAPAARLTRAAKSSLERLGR